MDVIVDFVNPNAGSFENAALSIFLVASFAGFGEIYGKFCLIVLELFLS
jgi:hypothetical protein